MLRLLDLRLLDLWLPLGSRRRNDARPGLALRLARLGLGLPGQWRGTRLGGLRLGFGSSKGERFFVVGDGSDEGSGCHADDGSEWIAGFPGDTENFEAVFGTAIIGENEDPLFRFFLVEQGDAVAAADG